jgi:hypothetical protein
MFEFNPMNFVTNLKYMGIGMLGVFIIIGVIMAATYAIGKFTANK